MIRPGKFTDATAIKALIEGAHARSKYAGRGDVAPKALENTVMALLAGQNAKGLAATHVSVAVRDGKVVGFIAGSCARIYGVLDVMGTSDNFLINEGGVGDTLGLVDAYMAWARSLPQVIEIGLSWSDAIPGAERLAALFGRKGMVKIGEQYALAADIVEGVAA